MVLTRVLCVIALAGCTVHTSAERPRVALKNMAWFAGGAAVGTSGYLVIRDVQGSEGDRGLGGAGGAMLLGTGIVMMFGATLGLLGVAFDDVPD